MEISIIFLIADDLGMTLHKHHKNDYFIREKFTHEEISAYEEIRDFQRKLGGILEDYINTKIGDKDIVFVGRDKNRPKTVDYIVEGTPWSVKNAWWTENSTMRGYRKSQGIHHWYRLNQNGTTNWENLFVDNVCEAEFREYVTGNRPRGLEAFLE